MKWTLTFWKDTGHQALRGKTVELFRIFWDEHLSEWIRDESFQQENGTHWGIYKLNTHEIRRLIRDPEEMGTVVEEKETAPPLDPEEMGVDHLEAEDVSVTPEGFNLGEEE